MRPISQHEPQGPDPSQRQVLALIGNRYVVFGSNMALPGPLKFTPASVRNPVSERVGDEFEPHPERVLKSIQVPDAKIIITSLADDPGWDFELEEGTRKTLVVLKLHA